MEVISLEIKKIACDLPGAEGPVFTADGTFFAVASFRKASDGSHGGDIVKVNTENGKSDIICAPAFDGYGGIPAGLQTDRQGFIWVADMRHGLLKLHPDGSNCSKVVDTDCDGNVMQGCNDLVFDYDGNLWLTAPAGPVAPADYKRSSSEPFGSVYCYTKDGKMVKVDANSYLFSNGIAVKHDKGVPTLLIVAETQTKTLYAYDITGPGQVCNKRPWATLPGDHEGGPDGMDFDADGNLLVANWGGSHIEVFSSGGGDPVERIKCPFSQPRTFTSGLILGKSM